MATVTLRLEIDSVTKKKNVWVKYDSDSDALPLEHEEQHKKIVEALLKGGQIKAEELGNIHIEREGQGSTKPQEEQKREAEKEAVKNS
jgi:hypothetical protein